MSLPSALSTLLQPPLTHSRSHTLQKTASGLFLPSAANSTPPPEGIVIAVGPGAPGRDGKIVPPSVKAGDRVMLPGFGGAQVKVGEEVRSLLKLGFGAGICWRLRES